MPAAKSSGGGAFVTSADSIPDPQKVRQARKATKAGPPPGFPPMADDGPSPAPEPSPAPQPAQSRPAGDLPRPTLTPSWSDGGGFLFGMFLYVLGINYLKNGLPGVKSWFAAKWLNKLPDQPLPEPGGSRAAAAAPAAPLHVTPGVNSPYSIPYDGKQ